MSRSWMAALVCPACGHGFTRGSDERMETLRCSSCGALYPVRDGIPRFVPPENYAGNFGFQWNRFRATQLDSHSGVPISRDRFMRQVGLTDAELRGRRVLDVGCGAGRFAEVALAAGAEVYAVDYSTAIDACRANLAAYPMLRPLQADVYKLPFPPGGFDLVYCLGVLQHTPDVHAAFQALARQVRPGGLLVVDTYYRRPQDYLHPKRWLRPLTTSMNHQSLFAAVERSAPMLRRVSSAVGRVPAIGSVLRRLVPVANYEGIYPLSEAQLDEWAVLDTFDWLAPRYDQPQTPDTLQRWFSECGYERVAVLHAGHLTGRGWRPPRGVASDATRG
jgi:SAM-dependent methyltransferase